MRQDAPQTIRVLAVASSGGHWVQLMRLRPAWQGCDVAYLTTNASYCDVLREEAERNRLPPPRFHVTVSANRWQKLRLIRQLFDVCRVVAKEKPAVIVSTGASPGYFAIRIGRMLGIRTVWIDSIANAGEMSLAGLKAARSADLWLTQWESVSQTLGERHHVTGRAEAPCDPAIQGSSLGTCGPGCPARRPGMTSGGQCRSGNQLSRKLRAIWSLRGCSR